MSTWTALNVEPESDSEVEIDDTKEIQVEEALKLYQNALKLHSQGPALYDEAEEAYDALFDSEIFTYPESQSEAKRLALEGDPDDSEDDDITTEPIGLPPGGIDTAPNTLPQILYLSYKNHGQFLLDRLVHRLAQSDRNGDQQSQKNQQEEKAIVRESLKLFTEALDRDDADFDLWRRTAHISGVLGSLRLVRFCLESVVDNRVGEEESGFQGNYVDVIFAREDLKDLLSLIQDRLSVLQMSKVESSKSVSKSMRTLMDPFPQLEQTYKDSNIASTGNEPNLPAKPKTLSVSESTWAGLGKVILAQTKLDSRETSTSEFGTGYHISLPVGRASLDARRPTKLVDSETLAKSRISPELSKKQFSPNDDNTAVDESVKEPMTAGSTILSAKSNNELDKAMAEDHATTPARNRSPDKVTSNGPDPGQETGSQGSLKRNSESAGLPDPADGTRSRSKRLRAKAELVDDGLDQKDLAKRFEEQLQSCTDADHWLFSVADELCSKATGKAFGNLEDLKTSIRLDESSNTTTTSATTDDMFFNALKDFRDTLSRWDLNKSNLLLHGNGSGATVTLIGGGNDAGLNTFLEHSKPSSRNPADLDILFGQRTRDFLSMVNSSWLSIDQLAFSWVEGLLRPSRLVDGNHNHSDSLYSSTMWPSALKEVVTQILTDKDEHIYATLEPQAMHIDDYSVEDDSAHQTVEDADLSLIEFIQTAFEIHLDIYGKMSSPSSKVDQPTRILQRDRLKRWAGLSSIAVGKRYLLANEKHLGQPVVLRNLWASVIHVSLVESSSRDHVLLCLCDLKTALESVGSPVLYLQNNSIMPEVSADAADREISRLNAMDLFLSIFDPSTEDPITVIETLEPILMAVDLGTTGINDTVGNDRERVIEDSQEEPEIQESKTEEEVVTEGIKNHKQQMSEFLAKATPSLRLSLWRRLKAANESIDYAPMMFLCNIRSIHIILRELQGSAYSKESHEIRTANLVVWIRNLGDLITHCLELARSDVKSLDCMDEEHLPLALSCCSEVARLFHVFALWEDSLRVGQTFAHTQPSGSIVPYKSAMSYLREMQPKIWMLLYFLIREAAAQDGKSFPTLTVDLVEYLTAVHNGFGIRDYCSLGKKAFLKFMKTELLRLNASDAAEPELVQLLYDLYGMKVCQPNTPLSDHGCEADQIDRSTAIEIVEFVMKQARQMNIKDLLKSDLKAATEKMQAVIGIPRSSSIHQTFNQRVILAHLKSPISQTHLYRCFKGIGGLTIMPVKTDYATIARKKWFFLLGYMIFARYRAQKRTAPESSNTLDEAANLLKLDLDFDSEDWETWYRLAQTYDAKIEEDVTWNADKINNPDSELVTLQRYAIHCYTMAVAAAIRNADGSLETANKMSELYTDFGNRIYASSRAPFSMRAFSLKDFERFGNSSERGTYKRKPFKEMDEPAAWNFASQLFRHALVDKPEYWINWYMLGKCFWKHFQFVNPQDYRKKWPAPTYRKIVYPFRNAVEFVPEKRDSRHPDRDPILEPHYKLVSITHKLVHDDHFSPSDGSRTVRSSPYARKVDQLDTDADLEAWEGYILKVLKHLRNADKANWHHRMVARAAHILYDDNPRDELCIRAAKHELNQQIFTKTMTVQIWRPEFERPGRYFVYTSGYVRFFVDLLSQSRDKSGLETLARKVRKKQGEYFDHTTLWHDLCDVYLGLIRRQAVLPDRTEPNVITSGLPLEEFNQNANRIEEFVHSESSLSHYLGLLLDALRETVELKKLNGNLIKPAEFDQLVEDLYARIYEHVVRELDARASDAHNRARMRIDRLMAATGSLREAQVQEARDHPSPPSTKPSAPYSTRKTISKIEIRKRAEALLVKPATTATPPPLRAGQSTASAAPAPPVQHSGSKSLQSRDGVAAKDQAESGPGSLHESADDESELTEIDPSEDEEPVSLFPGLVGKGGKSEKGEETETDENNEDDTEADEDEGNTGVDENEDAMDADQASGDEVHDGSKSGA